MEEVSTYLILSGITYDLAAVKEATSHTIQALGHAYVTHHTHLRQQWPFQTARFSYKFSYKYLYMVILR